MKDRFKVLLLLFAPFAITSIAAQKSVAHLKSEFDQYWAGPEGKKELMKYVNSDGAQQQYYYANWNLSGLVSMWQATGDRAYFDDAKSAINAMMNNAVDIEVNGNTYKGWPGALKKREYPQGSELWDSMIWKEVATLLRIMHQSPDFLVGQQSWYNKVLAWTEKNIWERYENKSSYGDGGGEDGNQFMYTAIDTSHWARIAMELYLITGKKKYKGFFDRASFSGCCTCTETTKGFSIRDQLYENTSVSPTAYGMYYYWGDFDNRSKKVDTPHFAAFVQFVALAYQSNLHWTKADIEKLVSTVNNVIWVSDLPVAGTLYIDGTGPVDALAISQGAQAILGRFDESFQLRLEASTTQGWNKGQRIGLITANRAILSFGKLYFGSH